MTALVKFIIAYLGFLASVQPQFTNINTIQRQDLTLRSRSDSPEKFRNIKEWTLLEDTESLMDYFKSLITDNNIIEFYSSLNYLVKLHEYINNSIVQDFIDNSIQQIIKHLIDKTDLSTTDDTCYNILKYLLSRIEEDQHLLRKTLRKVKDENPGSQILNDLDLHSNLKTNDYMPRIDKNGGQEETRISKIHDLPFESGKTMSKHQSSKLPQYLAEMLDNLPKSSNSRKNGMKLNVQSNKDQNSELPQYLNEGLNTPFSDNLSQNSIRKTSLLIPPEPISDEDLSLLPYDSPSTEDLDRLIEPDQAPTFGRKNYKPFKLDNSNPNGKSNTLGQNIYQELPDEPINSPPFSLNSFNEQNNLSPMSPNLGQQIYNNQMNIPIQVNLVPPINKHVSRKAKKRRRPNSKVWYFHNAPKYISSNVKTVDSHPPLLTPEDDKNSQRKENISKPGKEEPNIDFRIQNDNNLVDPSHSLPTSNPSLKDENNVIPESTDFNPSLKDENNVILESTTFNPSLKDENIVVRKSTDFNPSLKDENNVIPESTDFNPSLKDENNVIPESTDFNPSLKDENNVILESTTFNPSLKDENNVIPESTDFNPSLKDENNVILESTTFNPSLKDENIGIRKSSAFNPSLKDENNVIPESTDFNPSLKDENNVIPESTDFNPSLKDENNVIPESTDFNPSLKDENNVIPESTDFNRSLKDENNVILESTNLPIKQSIFTTSKTPHSNIEENNLIPKYSKDIPVSDFNNQNYRPNLITRGPSPYYPLRDSRIVSSQLTNSGNPNFDDLPVEYSPLPTLKYPIQAMSQFNEPTIPIYNRGKQNFPRKPNYLRRPNDFSNNPNNPEIGKNMDQVPTYIIPINKPCNPRNKYIRRPPLYDRKNPNTIPYHSLTVLGSTPKRKQNHLTDKLTYGRRNYKPNVINFPRQRTNQLPNKSKPPSFKSKTRVYKMNLRKFAKPKINIYKRRRPKHRFLKQRINRLLSRSKPRRMYGVRATKIVKPRTRLGSIFRKSPNVLTGAVNYDNPQREAVLPETTKNDIYKVPGLTKKLFEGNGRPPNYEELSNPPKDLGKLNYPWPKPLANIKGVSDDNHQTESQTYISTKNSNDFKLEETTIIPNHIPKTTESNDVPIEENTNINSTPVEAININYSPFSETTKIDSPFSETTKIDSPFSETTQIDSSDTESTDLNTNRKSGTTILTEATIEDNLGTTPNLDTGSMSDETTSANPIYSENQDLDGYTQSSELDSTRTTNSLQTNLPENTNSDETPSQTLDSTETTKLYQDTTLASNGDDSSMTYSLEQSNSLQTNLPENTDSDKTSSQKLDSTETTKLYQDTTLASTGDDSKTTYTLEQENSSELHTNPTENILRKSDLGALNSSESLNSMTTNLGDIDTSSQKLDSTGTSMTGTTELYHDTTQASIGDDSKTTDNPLDGSSSKPLENSIGRKSNLDLKTENEEANAKQFTSLNKEVPPDSLISIGRKSNLDLRNENEEISTEHIFSIGRKSNLDLRNENVISIGRKSNLDLGSENEFESSAEKEPKNRELISSSVSIPGRKSSLISPYDELAELIPNPKNENDEKHFMNIKKYLTDRNTQKPKIQIKNKDALLKNIMNIILHGDNYPYEVKEACKYYLNRKPFIDYSELVDVLPKPITPNEEKLYNILAGFLKGDQIYDLIPNFYPSEENTNKPESRLAELLNEIKIHKEVPFHIRAASKFYSKLMNKMKMHLQKVVVKDLDLNRIFSDSFDVSSLNQEATDAFDEVYEYVSDNYQENPEMLMGWNEKMKSGDFVHLLLGNIRKDVKTGAKLRKSVEILSPLVV